MSNQKTPLTPEQMLELIDPRILAKHFARIGGRAKSKRKAAAVRQNGKLGGRPVGSKDKQPRRKKIEGQ